MEFSEVEFLLKFLPATYLLYRCSGNLNIDLTSEDNKQLGRFSSYQPVAAFI